MDTEAASALGKEGVSEVISGLGCILSYIGQGLGFRAYLKLYRFWGLGLRQDGLYEVISRGHGGFRIYTKSTWGCKISGSSFKGFGFRL